MPTLTWLTRESDLLLAQKAPYRLLELAPELSFGDPNSGNMLIQGDNLEGLKALLPYYAGQVKCIYIDPPFNTKQAFDHYDDNLEHTIWLSLMYPRLELLKELLSDDGTIFLHIDDNELSYVIAIMDEIFGRRNRASLVTFKQGSATGHKAINPGMVTTTNYIVIYSKDKNIWRPKRLYTGRERDKRYGQFITNYEESYSKWTTITLTAAFAKERGKRLQDLKSELGALFEEHLSDFVLQHAERVIRTARPDYDAVGEAVKEAIDSSKAKPKQIVLHRRDGYADMYFKNGERWLFYKDKLKEIDGQLVAGEPLTNLWDDILSNNLHNEGGVQFPKGKKPEALIKRVLEIATEPNDIVLDSFLGSGTTTAVAHKMERRYIGIEVGVHAITHCIPRLQRVVEGDQGGISNAVNWKGGGGFRFFRLGASVFDESGKINEKIRFGTLAAHVWFCETKTPLTKKAQSPLLGVHDGTAYYLLFNGILGDKRPDGGNVLTGRVLQDIPAFDGPKVIYGETSRLGVEQLRTGKITFKQIPYDIKAR